MRRLLASVLIALAGPAFSQTPLAVPESESFALDGPSGTYEITVTRPPGYDASSPDRYPALYYLDAWWLRDLVTGTARVAALSGAEVEPVVLVGIGFEGDLEGWRRQRALDLTPGFYQSPFIGFDDVPVSGLRLDSTNTGGLDGFLAFLESEVFPRVEADYAIDPARRGVLGHSLGGLFGAWVLSHRPELFDRYLLISPATWWRQGEAIEPGFSAAGALDRRVVVAVGASEGFIMVGTKRALTEALLADTVAVTEREYPDRTHASVLGPAIWDGLAALYGPPDPGARRSPARGRRSRD